MSPAAEILVIILSVVLSIFLIVAIVLFVYLIRLSAEIRTIAKSAQKTVDAVEDAVSGFSKWVSPVFMAELIGRTIRKFTKSSSSNTKKGTK